ncbi:putative signal transducing protein [Pseudomonas sp. Pseusp97]|uniref:putative signal transducing protein n=1 Tax=Pseudomonas sp. Pseusp97 TaxID=3243065 RepID=UPI0039A5BB35
MQRIYEPADLIEAELLGGMLANEGISSHLGGRHLVGGIGELPGMGLLHLWVEDDVAEQARELIAAYNAAQPLPGGADDHEGGPGVLLC